MKRWSEPRLDLDGQTDSDLAWRSFEGHLALSRRRQQLFEESSGRDLIKNLVNGAAEP